jgi:hypothetical protein
MRRLLAVVAVLFLSACSDRHAQGPFGPFGSPQATIEDGSQNAGFWLLDQTWTTFDGKVCTFDQNYVDSEGVAKGPGTLCSGVFSPWLGDSNTELFPVVEICRVDGDDCSDGAFFVREDGGIEVPVEQNGKYVLGLKGQQWWNTAPSGTYRIIVAITFTGLDGNTPVPGYIKTSKKVLGYFEYERSGNPQLKVQFRIAPGALCDPESALCAETVIDPNKEGGNVIILDNMFKEYNTEGSPGVVGIKFPELSKVTQNKINVIFERVTLGPNEKCLEQPPSGKEVGPCYSVRTEPYIDLDPAYTGKLEDYPGPFIEFVICYDAPAGTRMWKWSKVKNLEKLPEVFVDFIDCDGGVPNGSTGAASAAPRHLAGFGGIRSRLMTAASRVLMPAPLHARRRTARFGGGTIALSEFTLVEPEGIQVNFTTPIAPGSALVPENLGNVGGVFTAKVQCLSQLSGTCPDTAISVPGTAGWDAVNRVYQVNWNTPKTQPAGEYAAQVYRDDKLVAGSALFSIRSSGSGPSYYTHNAGRNLPIKFFLSRPE